LTVFYLDPIGGNDANAGTSFALRWKSMASGATAARTAPGDTIRIIASPDPTLVGNATWTNNSKTITLASAVTQSVDDCESAWTPSTNVTYTASTSNYKEGTKACQLAIASAFTTGKVAFHATPSTLDLSGYQQISFWYYNTTAIAASTLSLRLCSDTAGVTTVNTIAIPACAAQGIWVPFTVDLGSALGSAIQSVALYADLDPGTTTVIIDNITACKASSSADSLSLRSLIGKVWNLSWVASATYAANDIRIPTSPNRNGFRYKVTAGGGGAAGSSEPTWPQEIGLTVTDGALTWTCEGLEESWYGIQSIAGTTVKLDTAPSSIGSSTAAYQGSTETVATYKREPTALTSAMPAASFNGVADTIIQEGGSQAGGDITYSGGWDSTAMSSQTGQTWWDGRCGYGSAMELGSLSFLTIDNFNSVRFGTAINQSAGTGYLTLKNMHHNNANVAGISLSSGRGTFARNLQGNNCLAQGLLFYVPLQATCLTGNGSSGQSPQSGINVGPFYYRINYAVAKGNSLYGINTGVSNAPQKGVISNLVTANNGTSGVNGGNGGTTLINAVMGETVPIVAPLGFGVYSQKHQGATDSHLVTFDGGTITSATDQRHTASGISWKFRPTNIQRNIRYPMILPVAKIAFAANETKTISIWVYRDNTNISGQLRVLGGQLAGVGADVSVNCTPSINTWTQYSLAAITPTEAGVLEVEFAAWDGTGTTNNLWIDDLTVA
jgi:hypothetical protein